MNDTGLLVSATILNSSNDDYYIAYYGYPISISKRSIKNDSASVVNDPDQTAKKGLMLLNDSFQQIDHIYKLGYEGLFDNNNKAKGEYYVSKRFAMEYYPMAALLNRKFSK